MMNNDTGKYQNLHETMQKINEEMNEINNLHNQLIIKMNDTLTLDNRIVDKEQLTEIAKVNKEIISEILNSINVGISNKMN